MILFQLFLFFCFAPSAEPQGFVEDIQRGVHTLSCVVPQHPHGQFAAHTPLSSLVISAYENNNSISIVIMQISTPDALDPALKYRVCGLKPHQFHAAANAVRAYPRQPHNNQP